MGIVIINETGSEQKVEINIPGADNRNMTFGDAYWYEIYAESIGDGSTMNGGSSKFYINGETGTRAGGGPTNFADVKPYKGDFENNKVFIAHKYSINYMVVDVTSDLSSNDIDFINIKIYPNPIKDILNIDKTEKIESIKFINMNGIVVKSLNNPPNTINVSDLKPNQYLLEIITERGISITKILKK